MIATHAQTTAAAPDAPSARVTPVSLEEYYSEAGPDYAAWSPNFNMHFGYFKVGVNPFRREVMLEEMNQQVLKRLRLDAVLAPKLIDLGCGLGASTRSFARTLPNATVVGLTKVDWQVEQATALNREANFGNRLRVVQGDYEDTILPRASFDGVFALESSCHAHSADKGAFLEETYRLLRPGGRVVVADGFLRNNQFAFALQRKFFRKLSDCWVIEELADLSLFKDKLEQLGYREIVVEHLQFRVAPSVAHIPWVTLKFLVTDVLFGKRKMTRARWNNILAPVLLPFVSWPLGPMDYCMISATKPR